MFQIKFNRCADEFDPFRLQRIVGLANVVDLDAEMAVGNVSQLAVGLFSGRLEVLLQVNVDAWRLGTE